MIILLGFGYLIVQNQYFEYISFVKSHFQIYAIQNTQYATPIFLPSHAEESHSFTYSQYWV